MIDLSLLRCLRVRGDYNSLRKAVPLTALEPRTKVLVEDIDKYYKEFPDHDTIDFIVFRDLFFQTWHRGLTEEQQTFYHKVLKNADVNIGDDVKKVLMNNLIELKFATDAANLIQQYESGDEVNVVHDMSDMSADALERLLLREDAGYTQPDFNELMQSDTDDAGLKWRIDGINRAMRPLRGGDFLIIAARPDKGKTSFIADAATCFASQCPEDRPILWLSNEGVRDNIIKRSISAALGETIQELITRNNAGTLMDDYSNSIGHNNAVQIEDICGWTNFEVADLIEQRTPSLVIFDMIDKIRFMGIGQDARTDQKLEEMYSWFREHGIKNDYASLATSQISGDGAGLEWPEDHQLKDSKTGKQGACDVIMMIGHSNDPMKSECRYISTPKNKLRRSGTQDLRLTTLFQMDRSRFLEVQS